VQSTKKQRLFDSRSSGATNLYGNNDKFSIMGDPIKKIPEQPTRVLLKMSSQQHLSFLA